MPDDAKTTDDSLLTRWVRFIGSSVILGFPAFGVFLASLDEDVPCLQFFVVYAAFILSVGLLLTAITGRLYRQHEMRQYRIDTASMILVTTLIAVPLGFANVFVGIVESLPRPNLRPTAPELMPYIAFLLYFLVIPIIFVTEFLVKFLRRLVA